jgi:hypothetical protein
MLVRAGICGADEFEAFVTGFNQANLRFTIIDVHSGKEAADVKIRGEYLVRTNLQLPDTYSEYLLSYACFPQISKIFFGGITHPAKFRPVFTPLSLMTGLLHRWPR